MPIGIMRAATSAVKAALIAWSGVNSWRLVTRLWRDQEGSQLVLIALLMPALVAVAALALDSGLWANAHVSLQGAADAAAASAAKVASANPGNTTEGMLSLEAEAIAAQYGLVNGQNGVTVTMNWPPTGKVGSGNLQSCNAGTLSATDPYFGDNTKFEVIISQPYSAILRSIGTPTQTNICGRAVASLTGGGICVLALNATAAGAFTASGTASVTLTGCGLFSNSTNSIDSILLSQQGAPTITATGGGQIGAAGGIEQNSGTISPTPTPNQSAITDPYASTVVPTPGTATFSSFSYPTPSTNCNSPTAISNAAPITGPLTLSSQGCYQGSGSHGFNNNPIVIGTGGCLILSASNGTYTFKGTGGIQVTGVPGAGCSGKSISVPNTTTVNVNGPIAFGPIASSESLTLNPAALNVSGQITVDNNIALTISTNTNVNGGNANSTAIAVNSGGSLTLSTGPFALNGGISNTGIATLNTLSGSNTYVITGGLSVSGGTVTVNPGTLNMNSGITVSGGQLTFPTSVSPYTLNLSSVISANGGTVSFNPGTYYLASGISASGGSVTSGSGAYTFTANGGITASSTSAVTLGSGIYTFYGPISTTQSAHIAFTGGIYILSSTSTAAPLILMRNTSSLSGTGTLVFTSNTAQYPNPILDLKQSSTVNITAPATGSTKGIAIFGDRSMPTGTQFLVENGTSLTFTGTFYTPKGQLAYQGTGATQTPCSQLVADSFNFANGTGSFANNCSGYGTTPILGHSGSSALVE